MYKPLKCSICGKKMPYKPLYDRFECKCGMVVTLENIDNHPCPIYCRIIPITFTLNNEPIFKGKFFVVEEEHNP